jgi:citrate lyase beta subunit
MFFFLWYKNFFFKYIDIKKDLDGLRVQSEQGFRMGFTGKQVIHPMQVDVTQEAFTPSKEKIKWACGLVEAFEAHQSSGAVWDLLNLIRYLI